MAILGKVGFEIPLPGGGSRELRLPCIVSLPGITTILKTGDLLEMDGALYPDSGILSRTADLQSAREARRG